MLQITTAQASLIVLVVGLLAGLIGWFGQGFKFLLYRWWTGTPKREDAAYLHSIADLAGKLRANGMTLNDVRQFEKIMRKPGLESSTAATQMLDAIEEEPDTYAAFLSNMAMKARTGADYGVADANLKKALVDLRLLLNDDEKEALDVAQNRWGDYRKALEVCAGLEFEGGTQAPLAGMMAGLTETERRTAEMRAQAKERTAR